MHEIVYTVTFTLHEDSPFTPGSDRDTAFEAVDKRRQEIVDSIDYDHEDARDIRVDFDERVLPGDPVTWDKPMDGEDSPWATDGYAMVRRNIDAPAVQAWRSEGLIQGAIGLTPAALLEGVVLDPETDPYVRSSYAPLLGMSGPGEPVQVFRPRPTAWGTSPLLFVVVYRAGEIVALLAARSPDSHAEQLIGMKPLSDLVVPR